MSAPGSTRSTVTWPRPTYADAAIDGGKGSECGDTTTSLETELLSEQPHCQTAMVSPLRRYGATGIENSVSPATTRPEMALVDSGRTARTWKSEPTRALVTCTARPHSKSGAVSVTGVSAAGVFWTVTSCDLGLVTAQSSWVALTTAAGNGDTKKSA